MVKKIVFIIMAVSISIFAAALSKTEIANAYKDSYALEAQGRYTEAIRAINPIVLKYENGYTINFRMGWLSYLAGNYANSEKYYKKSLAVYPASLEVMSAMCKLLAAKKLWTRVEEQSRRMLNVDYYNLEGNGWYAYALRMQKKNDQAIKVNQKMLLVYPTSIQFLNSLGLCYFDVGDFKSASSTFQSVLTLDPYNQTAKLYVGIIFKNGKK